MNGFLISILTILGLIAEGVVTWLLIRLIVNHCPCKNCRRWRDGD